MTAELTCETRRPAWWSCWLVTTPTTASSTPGLTWPTTWLTRALEDSEEEEEEEEEELEWLTAASTASWIGWSSWSRMSARRLVVLTLLLPTVKVRGRLAVVRLARPAINNRQNIIYN